MNKLRRKIKDQNTSSIIVSGVKLNGVFYHCWCGEQKTGLKTGTVSPYHENWFKIE